MRRCVDILSTRHASPNVLIPTNPKINSSNMQTFSSSKYMWTYLRWSPMTTLCQGTKMSIGDWGKIEVVTMTQQRKMEKVTKPSPSTSPTQSEIDSEFSSFQSTLLDLDSSKPKSKRRSHRRQTGALEVIQSVNRCICKAAGYNTYWIENRSQCITPPFQRTSPRCRIKRLSR